MLALVKKQYQYPISVMLCALIKNNTTKVVAWEVAKQDGPFECPECRDVVIVRKGSIRVHHFSHKPPVTCAYGTGEKEIHRQCKKTIFDILSTAPKTKNFEMERSLKTVRPDLSGRINGVPIAIEVQISNLDISTVVKRTAEYTRRGIALLWLAQWTDSLYEARYSPRLWERWLHGAYMGRVYYWVSDAFVVPVHFSDYTSWVESSEWYDSSGEFHESGGYDKVSKRYRTPVIGQKLDILRDFKAQDYAPFRSRDLNIPQRKLYSDALGAWWKQ